MLPGLAVKSYRELASGMFAHKSNLQLQGKNTLFSKHFGKYYQDFYEAWPGTKFQNDYVLEVIVRIGEEWFYFYL